MLTYAAWKLKEPDRLFDVALVVGLQTDDTGHNTAVHVLFHCPPQQVSTALHSAG